MKNVLNTTDPRLAKKNPAPGTVLFKCEKKKKKNQITCIIDYDLSF